MEWPLLTVFIAAPQRYIKSDTLFLRTALSEAASYPDRFLSDNKGEK